MLRLVTDQWIRGGEGVVEGEVWPQDKLTVILIFSKLGLVESTGREGLTPRAFCPLQQPIPIVYLYT